MTENLKTKDEALPMPFMMLRVSLKRARLLLNMQEVKGQLLSHVLDTDRQTDRQTYCSTETVSWSKVVATLLVH